jgi:hypothetical protein
MLPSADWKGLPHLTKHYNYSVWLAQSSRQATDSLPANKCPELEQRKLSGLRNFGKPTVVSDRLQPTMMDTVYQSTCVVSLGRSPRISFIVAWRDVARSLKSDRSIGTKNPNKTATRGYLDPSFHRSFHRVPAEGTCRGFHW